MTRISFRRHRDSRARCRLGSWWSAEKIFHSFEKYLVSKYPLIPTSQLIQFLVSVVWARLGTRRNGACLPTQSPWQLPRSRAPDTGNIFSKHRQNIFEFCDGFCRKTWAELTTEVSRKSGFSPCNTIHTYTELQIYNFHHRRHTTSDFYCLPSQVFRTKEFPSGRVYLCCVAP